MAGKMTFFKPSEFNGWHEYVAPAVLDGLERFRQLWGAPVRVSSAPGAVGRRAGIAIRSRHNVEYWGAVLAVDVMPDGMLTPDAALEAVKLARLAGFGGIGVYPHWLPSPGLHLDVRDQEARWGAIKDGECRQVYVTLHDALDRWER
jgi:hypothetical protein